MECLGHIMRLFPTRTETCPNDSWDPCASTWDGTWRAKQHTKYCRTFWVWASQLRQLCLGPPPEAARPASLLPLRPDRTGCGDTAAVCHNLGLLQPQLQAWQELSCLGGAGQRLLWATPRTMLVLLSMQGAPHISTCPSGTGQRAVTGKESHRGPRRAPCGWSQLPRSVAVTPSFGARHSSSLLQHEADENKPAAPLKRKKNYLVSSLSLPPLKCPTFSPLSSPPLFSWEPGFLSSAWNQSSDFLAAQRDSNES